MTRADVKNKVIEILVYVLGCDEEEASNETSDLQNDLGTDSLDALELVMEIEKEFTISIPDDEIETISTVGKAIDYIYKRVGI